MHPVVGGGLFTTRKWGQALSVQMVPSSSAFTVGLWDATGSGWVGGNDFFLLLVNCLFRWSLLSHQSFKPDSHCDPLQLRKGIFLNYQPFLAPLRSLSTTPGGADGCVIWFHPQAKCLVCSHWRASLALPVQGEGRPWQATHVLCLQEKTSLL